MKFEFYKMDKPPSLGREPSKTLWAWRLRADNGRVVAHHNQGYNSKSQMIYVLYKLFRGSKQEEALKEALSEDEKVKVALRKDQP